MSSHNPFWFADEKLLTDLLRDEIHSVAQLFARYPDLPEFFDMPEATVQQRAACFAVLSHCKLMGEIYETFAGHYESPSLGDEEKDVLRHTQNLFARDAPVWVLEVDEVAGLLPSRVYDALPEPLRKGGFGFDPNNPTQVETIRAAARTLSSVEQIQALTTKVVDEQLQRLERRWSAAIPTFQTQQPPATKADRPKGTEGLVRKNDLSQYSRYMDKFTEKQLLAFVLKYEYGLKLSQIAFRMGINRKTADEHIKAAEKKVNQARSSEKRKVRGAKKTPEF